MRQATPLAARGAGARLAAASPTEAARCALTSSTPDALWSSRSVRLLHPSAVETRGLRAAGHDRAEALRGLDLAVPVGARLLLASRPEGSASLLLRILAGLVRPAGGTFTVAGLRRSDDTAAGWARRIGYVGPETGLYGWLTPVEVLALAARLAELETDAATVAEAVDWLRLADADARRPMSRGGPSVVQRVALAAALIGEPEVLLLDEPLRSLDPGERRRLLTFAGRRLTVLIASRYPAAEEGLVSQVAFIAGGRLSVHATVEDLAVAGQPLTGRGIEALAELDGQPPAPPSAAATA